MTIDGFTAKKNSLNCNLFHQGFIRMSTQKHFHPTAGDEVNGQVSKKTGLTCESLTADDKGFKTKTKKTSKFGFTFVSHETQKVAKLPCRRWARWMYTRPVTWSWSSAGWPDWLITMFLKISWTDFGETNWWKKIKSLEFNQSYFLEAVFLRWKPLVCGPLHGRGSVCLKKEGEVLST